MNLTSFGARMSAEIVAAINEPTMDFAGLSNSSHFNSTQQSTAPNHPGGQLITSNQQHQTHLNLNQNHHHHSRMATASESAPANLFHRLARSLADSALQVAAEAAAHQSHQVAANRSQPGGIAFGQTTSATGTLANPQDSMHYLQGPLQQLPVAEELVMQQQQQQQQQSFSDWWNDYWSRQPFPSGYTQSSITLLACFISTIIFLIVVGNLLVCIAIFTEKSLKPTQNWFIASLAVSDMLLGALVMPISLARELMGFWAFGPLWCDVHEAMDVLLSTASINTLCLISLDRYWSITQAVSYLKKRTPRRGALMIAFVWIFSAAVSLPPLFGWKKDNVSIIVSGNGNHSSPARAENRTRPPEEPEELAGESWPQGEASSRRRRRHRRRLRQNDEPQTDASLLFDAEQEEFIANTLQPLLSSPPPSQILPVVPVNQAPASNQQIADQQQQQQTTEYPSCQLSDDVGYVLYSALGSFYIPCAVMVFTYIKIFLAARSRARRAISKSSRAAGAGERAKRGPGRRSTPNSAQTLRQLGAGQKQASSATPGADGCSTLVTSGASNHLIKQDGELTLEDANAMAPAAAAAAAAASKLTGKLVIVERKKSLAAAISPAPFHSPAAGERQAHDSIDYQKPISLSTSGAKLASQANAFANSNDSSMITVMNASMADVPVTRFSFQGGPADKEQDSDAGEIAGPDSQSLQDKRERQDNKTASLLKALSQVNASDKYLSEVLVEAPAGKLASDRDDDDSQVPDIVVRGAKPGTAADHDGTQPAGEDANQLMVNSTNETCFMTIEEDSDMFDAQAGRTIMMIAGNASACKQANSLANKSQVMTMMPAASCQSQQPVVCNNVHCRQQQRQQPRSASSYCGSSMTINDDDIDDCVDDELLTDDCNGYSVSCGLDQYCSGTCPHCHEEYEPEEQNTSSSPVRNVCHSPGERSPHHARRHTQVDIRQHHRSAGRGASASNNDAETQSLTGDDNLSLTEYRSNEEDSSSIMGHDVLDATESRKKKLVAGANQPAAGGGGAAAGRKRSMIGFRLGRLGSSAPLSSQSGGLLALAASTQQQRQQLHQQQPPMRNLKALRQNFFLKLNQLTAKSAAKQESKSRKEAQNSPSAPSSGTSYEPSVDCATTSNVHSTEYHHDDYEQNSSDTNQRRFQAQQADSTNETTDSQSAAQLGAQASCTRRLNSQGNQEMAQVLGADRFSGTASGGGGGQADDRKAQVGPEASANDNRQLVPANDCSLLINDPGNEHGVSMGRSNQFSSTATPSTTTQGGANNNHNNEHRLQASFGPSSGSGGGTKLREGKRATGGQINRGSTIISSSANTGSVANKAYLASDNERHKRKLAKARERRATLILGIIMTAFICSWLPFFTFYVVRALCIVCREYMPPRFEAFIFWMGYCNSAINPIIYTIFNRDFRRAFRKIIFRC